MKSATGLDGVSLADLKAMPASVLEAHCDIYREAELRGIWPTQLLVGKVASLAKNDAPSRVNEFRPITILPQCYRLWSGVRSKALLSVTSDRCPAFLFGNKPHCQASLVWTHLAWAVEDAFVDGSPIAGIVADIEKAFNHLPREVVFQTAMTFGLPFPTLTAWAAAMGSLARRFQIRQHLGPPVLSSTGFPEGCAMSCLAMLLMDCLFHKWFEVQFPLCQPVSYVDDLQLLTKDPQQIPAMLEELHSFSALVDLTVDAKKTFVWCNSAYHRTRFRRQALPIQRHARGLGAQLQFGRQHSITVIRKRIEEVAPLWPRLSQSLSPYKVKVLAIRQAAWSRCLHGIAATSISLDAFVSLRTQAMRGLNASGAGCNSCVHLGLVEHPMADPYCWAIVSTLRTVRECATSDNLAALLQEALSGSQRLPSTGMTSILLTRLHHLGWEITRDVHCNDGYGEFSLLDVNFSELLLRITWSWQKWVAATVSHRRSFDGLESCDAVSTRDFVKQLTVTEQGLMRKALNGALFTNDCLCYFSNTGSHVCQFCGADDSRLHRFWHCPVFSGVRQVDGPAFWDVFPTSRIASCVMGGLSVHQRGMHGTKAFWKFRSRMCSSLASRLDKSGRISLQTVVACGHVIETCELRRGLSLRHPRTVMFVRAKLFGLVSLMVSFNLPTEQNFGQPFVQFNTHCFGSVKSESGVTVSQLFSDFHSWSIITGFSNQTALTTISGQSFLRQWNS